MSARISCYQPSMHFLYMKKIEREQGYPPLPSLCAFAKTTQIQNPFVSKQRSLPQNLGYNVAC